jgi:hypothetical protein
LIDIISEKANIQREPRHMTSSEAKLLSSLCGCVIPSAAKAVLKRSIREFVLQYGWSYQPIELPKQIALAMPQECHVNALDLT